MAMTAALGRMEEFRLHASSTPRTGVTDDELDELLFQIAAYCGAPAGVSATRAPTRPCRTHARDMSTVDRGRLRGPRQHGRRARRRTSSRPASSWSSTTPSGRGARRTAPTYVDRRGRRRPAGRRRRAQPPRRRGVGAGGARDRRGRRPARHPRRRHLDDRRARRAGTSPTLLADGGIAYVDAPVSGGVAGARARTLAVMYAGTDDACSARSSPCSPG